MTALVVISDGRGYLKQSIPSLIENADPDSFTSCVMVCDDPDDEVQHRYAILLEEWLGFPPHQIQHETRRGGAAAIQSAWANVSPFAEYVFHLEEDWTFPEQIPLPEMVRILDKNPDLTNVILRRQPWGDEGPGGYIGDDPAAFEARSDHLVHTKGFWLNPGLYRSTVCELGWPDGGHEHDFTATLCGPQFAVYGSHDDPPRCHHIGDERSPSWTW